MSSRMVSRGGKTRIFAFVCMLMVFSAVLYIFHGTQVELDDVRNSATSCSHQLESVSSQLQGNHHKHIYGKLIVINNNLIYCFTVIVELKSKFEKSLEDEKLEHTKTKEELSAIIQDEKQLRDKQNVDSMNRYNELEQNYEVLQVTFILFTIFTNWNYNFRIVFNSFSFIIFLNILLIHYYNFFLL